MTEEDATMVLLVLNPEFCPAAAVEKRADTWPYMPPLIADVLWRAAVRVASLGGNKRQFSGERRMLDLMATGARQTMPGVAEYLLRGIVALEYLSERAERYGQEYMAAALGAPMRPDWPGGGGGLGGAA